MGVRIRKETRCAWLISKLPKGDPPSCLGDSHWGHSEEPGTSPNGAPRTTSNEPVLPFKRIRIYSESICFQNPEGKVATKDLEFICPTSGWDRTGQGHFNTFTGQVRGARPRGRSDRPEDSRQLTALGGRRPRGPCPGLCSSGCRMDGGSSREGRASVGIATSRGFHHFYHRWLFSFKAPQASYGFIQL